MFQSVLKPRVVMMDDASYEWPFMASLLQRDVRTEIDWDKRFSRPETLLKHAQNCVLKPDVILLDAEYRDSAWPLPTLVKRLNILLPDSQLICLAHDADENRLAFLLEGGRNCYLHGFWLKEDIGYGIAAMVSKAANLENRKFSYTPGLVPLLRKHFPQVFGDGQCLPRWRFYEGLTGRLREAAELIHLQGRSAPVAAQLMRVSNAAMHSYKNRIYRLHLQSAWDIGWYDEESLEPFLGQFRDLDDRDVKDAWVFHLLSSLPSEVV